MQAQIATWSSWSPVELMSSVHCRRLSVLTSLSARWQLLQDSHPSRLLMLVAMSRELLRWCALTACVDEEHRVLSAPTTHTHTYSAPFQHSTCPIIPVGIFRPTITTMVVTSEVKTGRPSERYPSPLPSTSVTTAGIGILTQENFDNSYKICAFYSKSGWQCVPTVGTNTVPCRSPRRLPSHAHS